MSKKILAGAVAAAGVLAFAALGPAFSQNSPANNQITPPQVQAIQPGDLFQDIPGGFPSALNYYAPAALLGNYAATLGGNNPENAIIGGDSTTNTYVYNTTGSSVTTTLTYGGPSRWAYWSGTNTAMTVSQDTTAGDFPAQYKSAFKMARTSGQTGVVQVCMAQEIESANSYAFAGQTAEIDFHATAGANFSAASSAMTVVLISGTGVDQGLSTAAFNYNAGGGGSSTWTGQVNTAVSVPITTTSSRYTVAIPVPAAASELAVALCFTPVGTAGTNDYVALAGIQLTRNSALTTVAGTAGAVLNANDLRAKSFARRSIEVETAMQQRYAYAINEASITAGAIAAGGGTALGTTTTCSINIRFPTTMRIAPTYTNALTASTFKLVSASQAATALSTPFSATLAANSVDSASINFTTTGMTAKDSCELVSAAGVGQMLWTSEL